MISLPVLANTAFQRHRFELDGSTFQVTLRWNSRQEAWKMSLASADQTPLVSGLALVTNRPILRRFRYVQGLPVGEFVAFDPSGKIDVAGYSQLGIGREVELLYFEQSDFDLIAQGL